VISIEGLTKQYGNMQALKDVSFSIGEGSIFGFVGPNGAGKSTTIKILATLLTPTSGHAYINGVDVTKHPKEVRRLIGYMPDFFGVYDRLKVTEYLDFYASCYHVPTNKRQGIIMDLLELTDLSFKADAYVDSLSRGMKQRLCLARCLVHDPKVLLLDEPASGLDPRARVEMRELLRELRNMGKSIIVSSHILPELAEMCDQIGIIESGELKAFGSVEEITSRLNQDKLIRIAIHGPKQQGMNLIEQNPWVRGVAETDEGLLQISFTGDASEQTKLLATLVAGGVPVLSFTEVNNSLEDLFMRITEGVVQ
jgi:ABC-2 type transport system ATP-binding protein